MNAHKLLNKFRGWALHAPAIKREIPYAEEEFFAFHSKDKLHESEALEGLFLEWFLFDRKTTGALKTPVELFIEKRRKEFSKDEFEFFNALQRMVFGLFETLSANPEKGLIDMQQMDTEKKWTVQDFNGSRTIPPRTVIFARLVPGSEFSVLTGWVVGYAGQSDKFREGLSEVNQNGKKLPLSPRDLLTLYAERIRWEEKGSDYCRNKLAALWQRWNPKKLTWKELEDGFGKGDQSCLHAATQALMESLPHPNIMNDALGLVSAYWNTFSGSSAGIKTPLENVQELRKGSKEAIYMERMMRESTQIFRKEKRGLTDEEVQKWLRNSANGENGMSPFDLIYDERVASGHPEPEKIGLHITVNAIDSNSPEMKQASSDYNRANDEMINHNFQAAIKLYESAYRLIQYDPSFAFRLLGNLGLCYAFLGEREKAMEVLQAALKVNPQYDLARKRLSELEKMTPDEYQEFIRTAPDQMYSSPYANQRTVKMIKRHAVAIKWKAPFVEWANSLSQSETEPKLKINDPNDMGTTYLVPESDHREDYQKTIKEVFPFIFEEELSGWSEDEKEWPKKRTYEVFQQWFEVIYNDMVLDLADETLQTEEF